MSMPSQKYGIVCIAVVPSLSLIFLILSMSNAAASQPQSAPSGAQAQPARAPQDRTVRLPGEDLSLNEMLRVMDVAREMQRNRELAQEMFRRDEVRAELRTKLMRSAQLAGDRVTEAEIDAAIDQYFATLNVYKDPEPSFKRFLAHTWVWRKRIAAGVAAIAITLGGTYYLFFSSNAPLSPTVQAERAVAAEQETASALYSQVEALTNDPAILAQAKSLQNEINAERSGDVTSAIAAREQLATMVDVLRQTYEVHITNDSSGKSLHDRIKKGLDGDRSNYYVVVEARDAAGKVIPQTIRNIETGRVETVNQWAEQVPVDVYQRLKADKLKDGLLNETLFSVKTRGTLEPTIKLPNSAGAPISKGITITQW